MKTFITKNSKETQKLGKSLAKELKSGIVIALKGDLGCGKTTFTQGFLKGLKIKGPYTSPTFLVIKNYKKEFPISKSLPRRQAGKFPIKSKIQNPKKQNIYHIDTYRVNSKDILDLGWEEIVADKNNVIIVEWADRIRKIIPSGALWIEFEWVDNNTREIKFTSIKNK